MTLSKLRGHLYAMAKLLGDVQAATHKKTRQGHPEAHWPPYRREDHGPLDRLIIQTDQIGDTAMPTHLYHLCHNARRMDRHSEAELWARFKAVRPQDACAVTPTRTAPHPIPEQIDAALEWAREYLLTR